MKDSLNRTIIELRQAMSQINSWGITGETPRMILAQQPLKVPADIRVRREPAPSLRVDGKCKSNLFLAQYKKEAMHAIRFPYLCCVLEGEIDMRLGIPSARRGIINQYHIINLPAQTCLLIPPGVFFPMGSSPHWERTNLPPLDSKMLWVHILPSSILCHTSTTQKGKHASDNRGVYVPDIQFAALAEMITDELRSTEKNALLAAQHALLLLLLRLQRGLSGSAQAATGQTWETDESFQFGANPSELIGKSAAVERACHYIQTHIEESYSLEDVANYAYVSPSYLTRLFRTDLKMSVMEYALNERLKAAHSLLINTEISVREIAGYVGYSQPPQFNRIFKQIHGVTPTQFRRNQRAQHNLTGKANK